MAEIVWSPQSQRDLKSIQSHIAEDSPQSGRVVPELNNETIRELLWRDYRIVYRLSDERVEIVAVFHGALPLSKKLER